MKMNEILTILGLIATVVGVIIAYYQLRKQDDSGKGNGGNQTQTLIVVNNRGQEAVVTEDVKIITNDQLSSPPQIGKGDSFTEDDYLKLGVGLTKAMKPTDKLDLNEGTL